MARCKRDNSKTLAVLKGHKVKIIDLSSVDDLIQWCIENGDKDRRVAIDKIDDVTISTVFVSCDLNHVSKRRLWFETMVFGGNYDHQQWRYSTWDEAAAGHAKVVAMVRAHDHKFQKGVV